MKLKFELLPPHLGVNRCENCLFYTSTPWTLKQEIQEPPKCAGGLEVTKETLKKNCWYYEPSPYLGPTGVHSPLGSGGSSGSFGLFGSANRPFKMRRRK